MTLEIIYEGHFSQVPGLPEIPKEARQAAKAAGVDIPGVDVSVSGAAEIAKQLGAELPGLPFDPGLAVNLLSGKIDVEAIVVEGAIQLTNAIVPGLGVALRFAMPMIKNGVLAVADVITGAKAKRDRRRRNWHRFRHIFTLVMDQHPLLIYDRKNNTVPSSEFIQAYKTAILTPSTWRVWGDTAVPSFVTDPNRVKLDYEGSGIDFREKFGLQSGRRTGVTYLFLALQEAEIISMLDWYNKQPGKKKILDKAIRQAADIAQRKAAEIKARWENLQKYVEEQSPKIIREMKDILGKMMLDHPDYFYRKDASGKIYGTAAYALFVIAALNKKYNPTLVANLAKKNYATLAAAIFKEKPDVLKAVLTYPTKKTKEKKIIVSAAEKPKSTQAKAVTKSLDKKADDLKKSQKKRQAAATKAEQETKKLREEIKRLKAQLAKRPTKKVQKQVSEKEQKAAAAATRAAVNKKLAKADTAQAATVKQLKAAVQKGKSRAASALTSRFRTLAERKNWLKMSAIERIAARKKFLLERKKKLQELRKKRASR